MRRPWRRSRRVFLIVAAPALVAVVVLVATPVRGAVGSGTRLVPSAVSCGSALVPETPEFAPDDQYIADNACRDAIWSRQNLAGIVLLGGLGVAGAAYRLGRPADAGEDEEETDGPSTTG